MSTNNNSSRERILKWTLVGAVVLCLFTTVATVGLLRWMRNRSSTYTTTQPAHPPSGAANWSPATFASQTPDGVRQTSEKSWSVKGGRAFMNVRRKNDETLEVRLVYPFDFLPPETLMLVQTRWDLHGIERQAGVLNITPEQIASLKAISPATDMPVSVPEKERLRSLFEDYLSAKDPSIEKSLVEAVTELDAKYYDRTVERIESIAEKVKNVLNPDQLAALSDRHQKRNSASSRKPVH